MLDSIASCGAQYVEPAFIVGYTEPFDESNAASRTNADGFFRNIRILAAHAERLEMIIGLENPGNGEDNLFNLAGRWSQALGTDRFAARPAQLRCREHRFTSPRTG